MKGAQDISKPVRAFGVRKGGSCGGDSGGETLEAQTRSLGVESMERLALVPHSSPALLLLGI